MWQRRTPLHPTPWLNTTLRDLLRWGHQTASFTFLTAAGENGGLLPSTDSTVALG